MKRILILSVALVVIFLFSACEKSRNTDRISSEKSIPAVASGTASAVSSEPEVSSEAVVSVRPEIVHVDGIKLSAYERTLTVGDRFMPIVTMSPKNASNKAEKWETSDAGIAVVNNYGNITAKKEGTCTVTVTSVDNPEIKAEFKVTVKAQEKIEITYIDGILIANKTYPLPSDYNPGENTEARAALNKMFADAKAEGKAKKIDLNMWVCSGFRSYTVQKKSL